MFRSTAIEVRRCLCQGVVGAALLFAAALAWSAPAVEVSEIRVRQQKVASAPNVPILYPHVKKHTTIDLKVGTRLEPGTELVAPPDTEITLTSINGNVIKLVAANTHFKIIGASAQGESFEVLSGKVAVFVNKQLSFFSVSSGATAAAAKRTQYTVEVGAKRDVAIKVIEGVVEVERPDKLAVGGREFGGYKSRESLNPGDQRQLARQPQARSFTSFAQARAVFQDQVTQATRRGDLWAAADWQYNLAHLAWDAAHDQAGAVEAARLFNAGLQSPIAQRDPRWAVLFAKGVGDSLFEGGEFGQAERHHRGALQVLESALDPALESYMAAELLVALGNDLLELHHPDQAVDAFEAALDVFEDDFGDAAEIEVGRISFSLGVAHQRLKKWKEAHEYFSDALAIHQDLAPDSRWIAAIKKHLREVEAKAEDEDNEDDYADFEDE